MAEPAFGPLGFGAANLGNLYRAVSDERCWAILEAAWAAGIRYFDTAPHYGLGLSERRLGAFLRTKPRGDYVLSTKVGRLLRPNPEGAGTLDLDNDFAVPADLRRQWDLSADGMERSLDESLERLGVEGVDLLYLHDPERHDLDQGMREALPGLARMRDRGDVGAIGVGSMDTDALLASARSGLVDVLMVAGRYTLADQPALRDVIPECESHGIGIAAAAVFNSGLLATDNPGADARFDYGETAPDLLARVRSIAAVCEEFGVSLPTAALHYPLRHPSVRSVVIGSSTPEQITQNAARMSSSVPDALWAALADARLIPA